MKNLGMQFTYEFFGNYGVSLIFYTRVKRLATIVTAFNEIIYEQRIGT